MALETRPPVITIMGHVDHGKTSLLDYLRKSRVAAGEAGGITQHIGAYQVAFEGKKLTFIDTPGHAAFNKMRERGAQTTDIVVLVVAANDGVKPQTIESIRHIKQAGVTPIVAINKTDLPDVYPDMAKAQLAEHGILVRGYGGEVDVVEISAKTGKGIDTLLETISLTADMLELKADPTAPLEAVVIESTKDSQKGSVATVIVQQGTLSVRQDITGEGFEGRVKRLSDEFGAAIDQVKPGCPAEIIGLSTVPAVGSQIHDLHANYDIPVSTEPVEPVSVPGNPFDAVDFSTFFEEKNKLKLIIKADVAGTLEAIRQTIDDESVELIDSGLGEITETDLDYAHTSGATILAFHIRVSSKIKTMAKKVGVKIRSYDVIYKLIEDLQKQMLKLMDSTIDEVVTGEAKVVQIFEMKGERIAGCKMVTGEIKKADKLHIKREETIIADVTIRNMMHGKEEITEVKAKNEFGMTFKQRKADFQVGDTIVAYYSQDEVIE